MIKETLKSFIHRTKLLDIATSFSDNAVILRYHSIKKNPEIHEKEIDLSIMHSEDEFQQHMEYLARHANVVTMDEIAQAFDSNKKLPSGSIAVTFDDGFKDNFEVARPIMNRFGIRSTIYVTTDYIKNGKTPWFVRLRYSFLNSENKEWTDNMENKTYLLDGADQAKKAFSKVCDYCCVLSDSEQEDYIRSIEKELCVPELSTDNMVMTFEDLRVLQSDGHTIGSHTISHPNLAYLNDKEIRYEMEESKKILESELKTDVVHFSYPNPALQPNWSNATTDICSQLKFKTAVLSEPGVVRREDNPLLLKRMHVPGGLDEFIWDLKNTQLGRAV